MPIPSVAQPLDRSLPLCEVVEQEYAALTGARPDRAPRWKFTADQILEPARLADRLRDAEDRAARDLGRGALAPLVTRLMALGPTADPTLLKQVLATGLNRVLLEPALYEGASQQQFAGVRFRSQTQDRILIGSKRPRDCLFRNRLILEDTFFELEKVYDRRLKNAYRKGHQQRLAALCLSGGGIRSATFALGIVQGLARNGLLDRFHYLSTVSGGGYLGGWLSAWIRHAGLSNVMEQLRASTVRPLEPEPTPIWHLRTYSNYLSPKLGLLSADTWTLVATYLRNLLLTWLVLVPPLVGVLSVPIAFATLVGWRPDGAWLYVQAGLGLLLTVFGFVSGVRAVRYVHENRPVSKTPSERSPLDDAKRTQRTFLNDCLLPLMWAALAATVCWAWTARRVLEWPRPYAFPVAFALIGTLVHWCGWQLGRARSPGGATIREGAFIAATGLIAGLFVALLAAYVPPLFATRLGPDLYTWLAVPVLLTVILLSGHIYIGYTSETQVEAVREWSARFSAWILIVIVSWLVTVGLVLMAPEAFRLLRTYGDRAVRIGQTIAGVIGAISGAVTLGVAHGADSRGSSRSKYPAMTLPLALAAPTFIVFLVMLLGWAGRDLITTVEALVTSVVPEAAPRSGSFILVSVAVPLLLILFGYWTAKRVDTNKFSLHAMYRTRLIRAYLGASRPAGERDPNPFTGFDNKDNVWMKDLWPTPETGFVEADRKLLHVVNVALNLVGGGNLAWQQRKAESFTMTPLHCGAHNQGYRPTRRAKAELERRCYGGKDGITLGTSMTISGAAVSPNMGYHSSTVISLLLTLFNARLGWWLANPGYAGRDVFDRSSPDSSLRLIVDEALGRTDNRHDYVYLSDGGHFENLGLYEMVLRRCHTIVVSDGGCDPGGTFEDLGNAIRRIRVDFGIPIDFRDMSIYPRRSDGSAQPGKYCAIGTIRYSCVDPGAPDGTLIYLKPAFYGTEPKDVYNYAQTSPSFPHESTGDQFFSEAQFESYRALGSHVIEQIVSRWSPGMDDLLKPMARFARQASDYLNESAVATSDGAMKRVER